MSKFQFQAVVIQQGKQFFFSIPVKRVRLGELIKGHKYKISYEDLTDPALTRKSILDSDADQSQLPNCPICGELMTGIVKAKDGGISSKWECPNCEQNKEVE